MTELDLRYSRKTGNIHVYLRPKRQELKIKLYKNLTFFCVARLKYCVWKF